MTSPLILQIALPTPLRRCFDYLPPASIKSETLQPGLRVLVPFGNRKLVGVIVGCSSTSSISLAKLKRITRFLDEQPIIPENLLELCQWCAHYYQHPIGEAIATALPSLIAQGETHLLREEIIYFAVPSADSEAALNRAPRQAQIYHLIQQHPKGLGEPALQALDLKGSPLKALLDKGLVRQEKISVGPPEVSKNVLAEAPLTLNKEQQRALLSVTQALGNYHCCLLEGVTGSGKTEVYLQSVERVLQRGESVLVLVPEIGLTPQTVARFKQRFNVPVLLMHSGLTDSQRAHDWLTSTKQQCVLIGTRSSVFTPVYKPGLIIVDEEHDLSYKQQDGLRYHARDVAIMRAHREQVPILLGSATPSLESIYNAQTRRYQHLVLHQRAGEAQPPRYNLIDIRSRPLQGGFSQPLIAAMQQALSLGNQVLVFLNRRGYSPVLLCHSCGWTAKCRRCDARLTLHLAPYQLHCHHCGTQTPPPSHCPDCQHQEITPIGVGTERLEETLAALFPKTRLLRIDRDTTRSKSALKQMMDQIHSAEPCLMIGTQMLAKGHHFPDVTLVAILEADSGLFSADFRAMERMGQLITQVSGRAGRASKPGQVLIQTHQPDNLQLRQLIEAGYFNYARTLLQERRDTHLPPYTHSALIRAESVKETAPFDFLHQVKEIAQAMIRTHKLVEVELLGPIPAVMFKRAGRYHAHLYFSATQRKPLHQLLTPLCSALETERGAAKVRWSIDIDPQDAF